jgi:hypothetical protein
MGRFRRLAYRSAVLVALAAASAPLRPALAAPKKGAETPAMAEARRHFEVGLALLKERNFGSALVEFRESYALGQRPSALRNIAQCQRELHEYAAAFVTLETLLSAHGGELKPADRTAIQRALEELRQLTALVDVRVMPAGAEVLVDGAKRGTTPLERLRVDAGTRKVRIAKAGYEPLEKTLEVVSMKDTAISGELVAEVTTGRLVVREVAGLPITVFVDGKSVGMAPYEADVAPGAHVVEGRSDRIVAKPRSVEVVKRGRLEVTLESAPITGRLRIRATPAAATVSVDGQPPRLGAFEGDLSIGRHALVVEASGYARVERLVDVAAGESIVQDIVLAAIAPPPEPVPVAPVAPPHVDPEPNYEGFYTQLAFHYAQGLTAFPGASCPKDANTYQCTSGEPMGGAATLRLGYSAGVIGFEGVAAAEVDARADGRKAIVTANPAELRPNVDRTYLTMRGFFGAGVRILTPGHVRFTIGATPGYAMQSYSLRNTYTTGGSFNASTSGGNFAMLFDAGFLFGPSPGTKVILGVQALADFVGSDVFTSPGTYVDATKVTRSEPAYQVAPSMNWFIMPTFGFQFGH